MPLAKKAAIATFPSRNEISWRRVSFGFGLGNIEWHCGITNGMDGYEEYI
jgi:hypothetical protein